MGCGTCILVKIKVISYLFKAIYRLGGPQMKEECDHLKSKALDQTNQQIMIDIKRSNEEITELKESMNSLTLTYVKMKEMINETVPWNIRGKTNHRDKY